MTERKPVLFKSESLTKDPKRYDLSAHAKEFVPIKKELTTTPNVKQSELTTSKVTQPELAINKIKEPESSRKTLDDQNGL